MKDLPISPASLTIKEKLVIKKEYATIYEQILAGLETFGESASTYKI